VPAGPARSCCVSGIVARPEGSRYRSASPSSIRADAPRHRRVRASTRRSGQLGHTRCPSSSTRNTSISRCCAAAAVEVAAETAHLAGRDRLDLGAAHLRPTQQRQLAKALARPHQLQGGDAPQWGDHPHRQASAADQMRVSAGSSR
jgi:hypothetical protein